MKQASQEGDGMTVATTFSEAEGEQCLVSTCESCGARWLVIEMETPSICVHCTPVAYIDLVVGRMRAAIDRIGEEAARFAAFQQVPGK